MADDDVQRGTTKRQIARMLGGSITPTYVLSEEDQIVFANEALGNLLNADADSLIGLNCALSIPATDTSLAHVASWLGLPPNVDRRLAGMHAVVPPVHENRGDSVPAPPSNRNASNWVRVSVPIEPGPKPAVLCFLKSDDGDLGQVLDAVVWSSLQGLMLRSAIPPTVASDLWFLLGESPESLRTWNQYQAAVGGRQDVHVIGPSNGPLVEIAHTIAQQRSITNKQPSKSRRASITIECHLMDHDLLRSMFELVDDQTRAAVGAGNAPHVVLNRLDQLPTELIPALCVQAVGKWRMIATSTITNLLDRAPSEPLWGKLVAQLDSHVVTVTALSERIVDIEALITGWLDLHGKQSQDALKYRWNRPFLDAMLAYSWPGDCGEFSTTMASAVASCTDRYLTDRDLPIAIRTFPSHIQRVDAERGIDLDQVLEGVERDLILKAVARYPKNRAAAAKLLGISRSRLLRRLHQWGLEVSDATPNTPHDSPIFEEIDDGHPGEN